jgi:hypothetical protein
MYQMNVPITDLLYDLKRDWGQPVTYISVTTSEADAESGQVGTGNHECLIAQAVIFPVAVARTFMNAARAGNFPYDSNYDKGSHVSLIQKSDFPLGIRPSRADTIITREKFNYEIKEINDLLEAWELVLVELPHD